MIIVPLSGDKILTKSGASYTALGYANYKDQPAVYVQGAGVETDSVPFDQIAKINSTPVKLTGGKVFDVATAPKGRVQLPQRDDKVKVSKGVVKVDSLKINQRGHLASGMLVQGTNVETGEKATVRLASLVSIERANGSDEFDAGAFRKQYADYLGSESGATT